MKVDHGSRSDVTILGAGIIGVCCALALQERGLSVTLIDRDEPGQGASYGNAGVISPWSCVPQCLPGLWKQVPGWLLDPKGPVRTRWRDLPEVLPWALRFLANARPARVRRISDAMDLLMRDNITAYRRLLAGTGQEGLLRDSLMVNAFRGRNRPDLGDLVWQLRRDHGAPMAVVDGEALREIEPALSPEYHSAIIVRGQARALAPGRLCQVLAEKAVRQRAILQRCVVREIAVRAGGGFALRGDEGELPAEKLVLCGGAWSSDLLRPLGIKLPLIAERGYHLEFTDPRVEVNNSVLDVAGKFIVSSMADGLRGAGTAEFARLDAPPNYKRAQILAPLTKRLLPDLNTRASRQWMGIRPSFPDNLPAIGEVNGIRGLFTAFGHSHYGLGMAPATGRMIADDLTGVPTNADISAVRVDRFL